RRRRGLLDPLPARRRRGRGRGAGRQRLPLRPVAHRRGQGSTGRRGSGGPMSGLPTELAARLKRTADGLVGGVAQAHGTGEGLMVAWMKEEALPHTLTT